MNDQEDFKSPEEIQADLNRAKINGFFSNIGWQCIVLTTVIYATYMNNWVADLAITGYGWLLALSCVIFFFTVIKPLDKLSLSSALKKKSAILNTPTAKVLRVIGTMFSVVEISLLFTYDYPALAGLWIMTEFLQYAAAYKLQLAAQFDADAADMVDRQWKRDPAFGKDLNKDMEQYQEDMVKVDQLIRDLKTDDDYPEALDALILEKEKLINAMEARITRAALETMQNDDEK